MAQRKRRASTGKTKRAKAASGRRPKRKGPATRRKKVARRTAARPAAARPDRNAARVAELEAENGRLREELDRVRAELADRPAGDAGGDLPPDEPPPNGY
jgi:hypothetical protein